MGITEFLTNIFKIKKKESSEEDEEFSNLNEIKKYKKKYNKFFTKMFKEKGEDFKKEIEEFESIVIMYHKGESETSYSYQTKKYNVTGYAVTIKPTAEELNKAYILALKNIIKKKFFDKEDATRILNLIHNFPSIMNMFLDLAELKIHLRNFDYLKSKNRDKRNIALLTLKQRWIDKVDILKENFSMKNFVEEKEKFKELINAFLITGYIKEIKNSQQINKEINKLDLNEEIKNILREKIPKFYKWVETSEKELRKRYEVEKKLYIGTKKDTDNIFSYFNKNGF